MMQECVSIASMDRLKHVIHHKDNHELHHWFPSLIGEINQLLQQYGAALEAHDAMVRRRNE